jgi:hypothetical protein
MGDLGFTWTSKMMRNWWNLNRQLAEDAGIISTIQVSSWALVVDLFWSDSFADVRTTSTPQATPIVYQPLKATGDTLAVYIRQSDRSVKSYDQGAFLLRSKVTTQGIYDSVSSTTTT